MAGKKKKCPEKKLTVKKVPGNKSEVSGEKSAMVKKLSGKKVPSKKSTREKNCTEKVPWKK